MSYSLNDLNDLRIILLYTSLPLHFMVLCYFLLLRWLQFWCEQRKMHV